MTIQHRSHSDWFFLVSYSLLGVSFLACLAVGIMASFFSDLMVKCEVVVIVGFLILDLLLYIRYDLRIIYKREEDKTIEERRSDDKRKTQAKAVLTAIAMVTLSVYIIFTQLKIVIQGIGLLFPFLWTVALTSAIIVYTKKPLTQKSS
jgi:di/tricarboxylate transporter